MSCPPMRLVPLVLLLLLPLTVHAQIEIRTLEELSAIRNDMSGDYVLMNDIDASPTSDSNSAFWNGGQGWEPIGSFAPFFQGTFDGNEYTISNLYINRPATTGVGLFGVATGTIKNVQVLNANVTGGTATGILGGLMSTQFSNCGVTGTVVGLDGVGGLGGDVGGSKIDRCFAGATVTGTVEVGGLVGRNDVAPVQDSYATGSVTATDHTAGGLVGRGKLIARSFSIGSVSAPSNAGGLLGRLDGGDPTTVERCYWDTQTSGLTASAAGTGLTTAEMYSGNSYPGWDFRHTWDIAHLASYPYLRWQVSSDFVIDTDTLTWTGDRDGVAGSINGVAFTSAENAGMADFIVLGDLLPNVGSDSDIFVTVQGSRPCRIAIVGNLSKDATFLARAVGQEPGPGGGRGGTGGIGGGGGAGAQPAPAQQQPAGGNGGFAANGQPGAAGRASDGLPGARGFDATPGESGGDGFGAPGSGGVATVPPGGIGGTAGARAAIIGGGGSAGTWFFFGGTPGGAGGNGILGGSGGGAFREGIEGNPGLPGMRGDDGSTADFTGAPGLRLPGTLIGGGGGAGAAAGGGGGGGSGGDSAAGSGGGGGGSGGPGTEGRGGNGGGAVQSRGGAGGSGGMGASNAHGGGGGGALQVTVLGRASLVVMDASGAAGVSTTGEFGSNGTAGEPSKGPNPPTSSPTLTAGAGGPGGISGPGGDGGHGANGGNATGGGGAGGTAIFDFGFSTQAGPGFAGVAEGGSPNGQHGSIQSNFIRIANPHYSGNTPTPYVPDLEGGPDAFGVLEGRTAAEIFELSADPPPGATAAIYRTKSLFGEQVGDWDWFVYANLSSAPIDNPAFVINAGDVTVPLQRAGLNRPEFGGAGIQTITSLPPGAIYVCFIPGAADKAFDTVIEATQSGITRSRRVDLWTEDVIFLAPPVPISTLGQLAAVSDHPSWDYILTNDIDASSTARANYRGGLGWEPIGRLNGNFSGQFDGNGFAIDGLNINRPEESFVGLFTRLENPATITNLTLRNISVSGDTSVGGLAGSSARTRIQNCHVDGGTITSRRGFAGGLIGGDFDDLVSRSGSLISECSANGVSVSSSGNNVGGLIGGVATTIYDCHATGSVSAPGSVGGLVGVLDTGSIERCTADVRVAASGSLAGGLLGLTGATAVSYCSASGDVSAANAEAGGLIGYVRATSPVISLFRSSASGNVSARAAVGGLVANIEGGGEVRVDSCYAVGNVDGGVVFGEGFGALIGKSASQLRVRNSYATGDVGGACCGPLLSGLVGKSSGSVVIEDSYTRGNLIGRFDQAGIYMGNGVVSSTYSVRTFIASDLIRLPLSDSPIGSYWNFDVSGLGSPDADSRTTAEMTEPFDVNTYFGWDFDDIWQGDPNGLNNGYPFHRWQDERILVTYTPGIGGSIVGETVQERIPGASTSEVTAVPQGFNFFIGWSDGVLESTRTDRSLSEDITVTALFASPGSKWLVR